MNNKIKTIVNGLKKYVDSKLISSRSDWNQNDKNKESYIKNKPFYDSRETIVETENISLSFDGNLEGKESIDVNGDGSAYMVKISDTPLTKEQIVDGILKTKLADGTENTMELSEVALEEILYEDEYMTVIDEGIFVSIFKENSEAHPFNVGVWGIYVPDDFYISSFTNTITTETAVGELKKIDEKFLPKDYATVDEVVEVEEMINASMETINDKMNKENPTGTGSFSMNRKAGTTVGGYSHAEGLNTTASGEISHAEGSHTTASGSVSHAEGYYTTASGDTSHAEGALTTASEYCSHAEGYQTNASGEISHAEGSHTKASGDCSHAEGYCTTASGEYQHVQGKWNIEDTEDTYAHIVGNGTEDTARSNAHTLDWDGNAWFAGSVEGTALILLSPNGTRFNITVGDDGVLSATEITE